MKNVYDVLKAKEEELARLEREVAALRIVAPLLSVPDLENSGLLQQQVGRVKRVSTDVEILKVIDTPGSKTLIPVLPTPIGENGNVPLINTTPQVPANNTGTVSGAWEAAGKRWS